MIILDAPYISDYLIQTIKQRNFPVLNNSFSNLFAELRPFLVQEDEFIRRIRHQENQTIYSNTENAIGWIAEKLSFTNLPETIAKFKNKVKFRELFQQLYLDFFFKQVALSELDKLDISSFPFPFIIKPAVGFFSMGVYKVDEAWQWKETVSQIYQELERSQGIYPQEVFDAQTFIIEEYITGNEFAFDAYFDAQGEPVLLNAYQHYFAHENDVSDRVYFTSKEILLQHRAHFSAFLTQLGSRTKLKNFAIHLEVRISEDGKLVPIEANPFRFGGWCTTADITEYAFGFNPYEYYLLSKKPDWDSILQNMNDSYYSIIVLNNSTGINGKNIITFDYDALGSTLSRVLELRIVDVKTYPLFGFVFAEIPKDRFDELVRIAESSLREFITI